MTPQVMKVHLRQIPQGETIHMEGEESAARLDLHEARVEALGPLRYVLDIGVSEGGLFGSGSLGLRVRFPCVLCVGYFERDIVVDPFAFQIELTGSESVDLTPVVREDIHLCLPPHPRCDSEGGPKCPAAYESALSTHQNLPEKAASAWDALDKIKSV